MDALRIRPNLHGPAVFMGQFSTRGAGTRIGNFCNGRRRNVGGSEGGGRGRGRRGGKEGRWKVGRAAGGKGN
eukprot:2546825-Pyramimonas_sp.AAC.1